MPLLLADENVDLRIVRGSKARLPSRNVVTVREVGLAGHPDHDVLAWPAEHGRIVLAHDVGSMTAFARERVVRGQFLPGLIVARQETSIGVAIDDLMVAFGATAAVEWPKQIRFLPL